MRAPYRLFLMLLVIPAFALADGVDHRSFSGACASPANINWNNNANWSPSGQPSVFSSVSIPYGSPYVAVTGPLCLALDITIQSGGKLALRTSDNGKTLGVVSGITVNTGGAFVGMGASGANGPLVVIGGDIVNNGTWNLSGISTGHPAVILVGFRSQRLSGSRDIVFENLCSIEGFVVDGVDVYVAAKYCGPWPKCVNNGHFFVGEKPLPITLAYFRAALSTTVKGVNLVWRTVSEINNYGFYVERRSTTGDAYDVVTFVPTQGNGITPHDYTFTDASVTSGSWVYRLRQVDLDGTETSTDGTLVDVSGLTAVNDATAPVVFALGQNYPNPFNPATMVNFSVDAPGTVRLKVYDAIGREVATLYDGPAETGRSYSVSFNATGLSSGTYFYRLENGSKSEMKKMLLVR
jgi:hypothetical protein